MFVTAPIAGRVSAWLDPRAMMAIGFAGFGLGTWMATGITGDWAFDQLLLPQILRGASLMFSFVPINNIALGTLPPERLKNASGLFNLTRNLGGAVGLALINTLLNHRWDLHLARLHESVNWANAAAVERLDLLTQRFHDLGSDAGAAALKTLAGMVRQQALVMSFADVFAVLTVMFVAMAAATVLVQKPKGPAGGGGH